MDGFDITTLETPSLGDRSYVVSDGSIAVVVDPQRDIDRVLDIVDSGGLELTHVFETHIHNDYVTGGLELSRNRGAAYIVAGEEQVSFERHPVSDGDEISVGDLNFRAVHSPGHTPHHFSYVVRNGGRDRAVFTGGSMLFGSVGRTDLISQQLTDELTRAQYRSVRRLAATLDSEVEVMPTHGFGSFCSSTPGPGATASTIGSERAENLAVVTRDEDDFVRSVVSGLTAYPRYYAHMAPVNRRGPAPIDLSPPRDVHPAELQRRLETGEWIVDVRRRLAYAAAHLQGTLGVELGNGFATYLGWVIPWGTPLTLVGDTAQEVEEAQRQLLRIGIDRPEGRATGGISVYGEGQELASYRVAEFAELARARNRRDVVILDARRDDEWADGRVAGAIHIPLPEIRERADELPDKEVWVYCAGGFRASIGASLLDGAGKDVVLINDDFERAREAGLEIVYE
ncbi:MAG: MBL fold metallo-hydrolase [Actinomycetota bacterium]|nr:MBL fold metallo-hydrolase [Actinomycetota bacterium]